MAEVTAAMIKDLRERTGVGMGKCKEALEEAKGDMDLAIANLRKAGMASAVKKEGREAKEGMIGVGESGNTVALVEINAETDFVAKNERFKEFVLAIATDLADTNPPSLDAFLQQKSSVEPSLTIDQHRATIIQTIGENIQIKRVLTLPKSSDRSIGVYSHLGGKIVTLVEITGSGDEETLAKDIAMHVAAASPEYLSPEKVPPEIIESEKEIARGQVKDKPANVIDKIVEGKVNSFFDTSCLTRQKFIKDDTLTIEELVKKHAKEKGKSFTVTNFIRWTVGQ